MAKTDELGMARGVFSTPRTLLTVRTPLASRLTSCELLLCCWFGLLLLAVSSCTAALRM